VRADQLRHASLRLRSEHDVRELASVPAELHGLGLRGGVRSAVCLGFCPVPASVRVHVLQLQRAVRVRFPLHALAFAADSTQRTEARNASPV